MSELLSILGIGPSTQSALEAMGIRTRTDLAQAKVQDLTAIRGISVLKAEALIKEAQGAKTAPHSPDAPSAKRPKSRLGKPTSESTAKAGKPMPKKPELRKAEMKSELSAANNARKKAKAKLMIAKAKLKAAVKAVKDATSSPLKPEKKVIKIDKAAGKKSVKRSKSKAKA